MNLDNLHFCRENKVRFRKHLTAGALAATAIGFLGSATNNLVLQGVGGVVNLLATIFWIWE